ncbi:ImmA/IrrE family metallo-endopeptidase [Lactiplantibacillus pentosus]|uniref:ImmA/IrrE family metallo-endopeptidase n=1 Tax=Lactiplantibacillus pentosus TaxID=1589 RepID=UPI003C28582B
MAVLRIPVNPEIIDWAISNGEKNESELLKKYALSNWKNPQTDHDYPTFKQIQNFSRDTRIPFNYFFKTELPREKNEFVKFRTVNNQGAQPSRRLIDTIYDMEMRQAWMKDYLLDQNESTKFQFEHIFNDKMDPAAVSKDVIGILDLSDTLGIAMSDDDFFNILRTKISALGILVMQNGVVGTNTRRPLDVDEFRALVLMDSVVPLIFINSRDSKKAKIFSLIHELMHAFLGNNEVLNVSPDLDLVNERWINQVTINVLMPADKVKELQSDKYSPEDNLTHLSKKFHTSLVAAAIRTQSLRLFENKLVDWAKRRQAEELRLKSEQKAPGGDFYNTAISRIDRYYANAVINAESSGDMAIAKAASMLGVTLKTYHKTVDKILEMA